LYFVFYLRKVSSLSRERRYFNSGKKQSTGERRYFISGKKTKYRREKIL
jgi:hypothetical protein